MQSKLPFSSILLPPADLCREIAVEETHHHGAQVESEGQRREHCGDGEQDDPDLGRNDRGGGRWGLLHCCLLSLKLENQND